MRRSKVILEIKWKGKWYFVHEEFDKTYLVSEYSDCIMLFGVVKSEVEETRKYEGSKNRGSK